MKDCSEGLIIFPMKRTLAVTVLYPFHNHYKLSIMLFLSVPEVQTWFPSKTPPFTSLYEILSEAFPNLCEAWLSDWCKKQKGSPPERYIFIAMLCGKCMYIGPLANKLVEKSYIFAVTLSLTFVMREGKVPKKTTKLWQKHLVEVC